MKSPAAVFVYVSKAPEEEIQIYKLNPADGSLSEVETVKVGGQPGAIGFDPTHKFMYASIRSTNSIAAYQVDAATGKVKLLNTVPLTFGQNAAFVGTDRTGKWLISASYLGARTVVHKLNADGTIDPTAVDTQETAKTAHSFGQGRDNKFVFVPHVAPNAVYQFRFDAATGKLTPAGQAPGGKPGAGPRHIALHPTLDFMYTSDESGRSITAYRHDPATGLNPVQTLSTVPPEYEDKGGSTAEVKIHPSGKYVWISNRGHDSLAGFTIAADGKLTANGHAPTEEKPRSFEIDPSGKYVFGAGEASGKLAVFRCDEATGKLERIHTYPIGKSLTWVKAVELGK